MTLIVKNANVETLRVIESLKGLNKDLVITTNDSECPICKAHNYTPKMTKEMREALKESEDIAKNPHKYPSYKNAKELLANCLK
ncbi:hypothetical protein [Helicobacter sp. 23-1045]